MRATDQILIFPPDDSAPAQGFFAVRLRKNCPFRALGVICNQGVWHVWVDGRQYAEPSQDWKLAFGSLYQLVHLQGKKLSMHEYKNLALARTADALNGVDLNKPISPNQQEVAI
jgi:hypothetical protein